MVAGVSMVRDEIDIVEPTVRQMASQVDFLIVADNRSRDGTRELLGSLAGELPLTVVEEPQVGYYQSQAMTALAERAAAEGATWIVPFDADEWLHSPHGRIADVLAEQSEPLAYAASFNHVPTSEDDSREADPTLRIGWRERERAELPKVACRACPGLTIHQGNHSASYAECSDAEWSAGRFEIRHFQWRSAEQFERKVRNGMAAIAMTGFEDRVCHHWREYGAILEEGGSAALARVFYERHHRERPSERRHAAEGSPGLIFDPVRSGARAE